MNSLSHPSCLIRPYKLLSSTLAACAVGVVAFSAAVHAAAFTNGNLAVLQVDASSANTTGSVVELSPTAAGQTPTNVITLDGTTSAVALRFSGSATSTGYVANSADGTLLTFTGANNTNTSANVNTLNPRAVGTLNNLGSFNLATTYTGVSNNQTRGATTLNKTTWYIGDQNGIYTNASTSASPSGNFRSIKAFGSTVYGFTSSASLAPVATISAASGGTATSLPGLAVGATSRQDFYLISSGSNGTTFDTLYVLDATSGSAGTIFKYSLVAGSWTANGSYTTAFGGFGLAATKSGTGAALFVSTGTGATITNSVIRVTDTAGFNSNIAVTTANNVTLYTAATGKIIKGVAFAPTAAAVTNYTLTYTAGANGSITGTTPQTVASGGNGTAVTAVANTGYHFTQWSDGSTTNPRTESNVTANLSISASFAINTYTLTYTANANGSITGTSPQTVNYNTSGSAVTAVPSAGYSFTQWSDGSTANPRTDANVVANLSVSASFALNSYSLTYTANANGSISGITPQTVGSGNNGTAVTALPNTGYHFTQWSDASTANPRTDSNVTANLSVSASFAINTYTLTYDGNGNTGGSAPVDASGPYNYNSTVTVLDNTGSLIKTGYALSGWNTAANGSGTDYSAGSTFSISANTTLYAKWLVSLPSVVITEVAPWSSGTAAVGADWFELTNTGSTTVNITGWTMDDNSNSFAASVALSGITSIAPGESVIFIETTTATGAVNALKTAWFGSNPPPSLQIGTYSGSGVGLSGSGDAVNIFDGSGNRVTGVAFGASPTVAPLATFDNKASLGSSTLPLPIISTLSVTGTNGAFVAANDSSEIGSPGTTNTVVGPDLTVNVTAPATATSGVNFDYTITVSNIGTVSATGVALNFTLPDGLNFVSASGTNSFTGTNNLGVINFIGGSINAASFATLTVSANAASTGTYAAAVGAAIVDPANAITEANEYNNTSTTATSTVISGPTIPSITTQPASISITTGSITTLNVAANGSPAPSFQWYAGTSGTTTTPVGTNDSSFTTPSLLTSTNYWVRVTNSAGSVDSTTATVTVSGYLAAYTSSNLQIKTPDTNTWNPAGVTVNGTNFINLGLQGVGRIPAGLTDTTANAGGKQTANTGESVGSVSDMQISDWKKNSNGTYSGTFNTLPDRGYNSGTIYSNFAARVNKFDFTFTPYTSNTPTTAQNQINVNFSGSERFTYDRGGNTPTFTTGLLADATTNLFGVLAPAANTSTTQSDGTVSNRLSVDAEGFVLDRRAGKSGAGWVSDEYGPYIYHFNSSKQLDGQLQLPAALLPHKPVGTLSFVDTNVNGRRTNQGLEGLSQSPDGRKLFGLMQSATLQDSGSTNQSRYNTRLLVYDVSASDVPNDPVAQYVIQLPQITSSGNGSSPDRNGAQSSILSLNDHQILILSRDGNGRGASGSPVFKSILLADLSTGTNIDGLYDAEGAAVAPGAVLSPSVTPLTWSEALNMIGKLGASSSAEVAKFGLNLNTAPGDINTICEKWEALALVSANDSANPNDYFLFVSNDNDFISGTGKYMATDGTITSYDAGLENDTLFLAWRIRMTGPDNQAPFVANTIPNQSAFTGSTLTYQFPSSTFTDPESGTLNYSATMSDGTSLPSWLSFNPATRTFTGTPSTTDIGTLVVMVTTTDNGTPSLSASTSFTITISPLTFLGVASGDADSSSAILWTRTNEGVAANLTAQVATDLAFSTRVAFNTVVDPTKDCTAKVSATGLAYGTKFYYRFVVTGSSETSGIGTFKTAPAANTSSPLHFAFSGDNDGLIRPYALASLIPAQNLDFYINLGDVIYENASNLTTSGAHNGASWLNSPSVTLSNDSLSFNGVPRAFIPAGTPFATGAQLKADYEKKYRENFLPVNTGGQNSLQVLYASQGNYTTWDNHELGNRKYIDGGAPAGGSVGGTAGTDMASGRGADARDNVGGNVNDVNTSATDIMNRAPGWQILRDTFLSYQPMADRGTVSAPNDPRTNGTKQLYSSQKWGKNAIYINTDARSYRDIRLKSANASADDTGVRANNPNRTYLGATQLAWLQQNLLDAQNSGATWKFVSISDPIDQIGPISSALGLQNLPSFGAGSTYSPVNSDGGKSFIGGYRAERNNLLKFIADNHITNVVFMATDDHQNRINEVTYSPSGQLSTQSSYVKVPYCFSIVCGPLGATGPDLITNHTFSMAQQYANSIAAAQQAAGVETLGLIGYPGLKNLVRDGHPAASTSPEPVDFYSPDTFNFTTLDVSADGKTLSVSSIGMDATAQNAGIEYANGPQAKTVFSFQIDAPSPVDTWRLAKFGTTSTTGNLANNADFDNDGIQNLVEYGLGTEPTSGSGANGPAALPMPSIGDANSLLSDRLALSFTLTNPNPEDLTYTVQASDDLGTWSDVARKTGTAAWTWLGGGSSRVVTSGTGPVTVKIGDSVPSDAAHPRRMMRLKITNP